MITPRYTNRAWVIVAGVVFAGVALVGCTPASIVGGWSGESEGEAYGLTILSDGTGDATQQGQPTKPLTWKRVKDGFEITLKGRTLIGTLRENGTLALRNLQSPEMGLLIMKRSQNDH